MEQKDVERSINSSYSSSSGSSIDSHHVNENFVDGGNKEQYLTSILVSTEMPTELIESEYLCDDVEASNVQPSHLIDLEPQQQLTDHQQQQFVTVSCNTTKQQQQYQLQQNNETTAEVACNDEQKLDKVMQQQASAAALSKSSSFICRICHYGDHSERFVYEFICPSQTTTTSTECHILCIVKRYNGGRRSSFCRSFSVR